MATPRSRLAPTVRVPTRAGSERRRYEQRGLHRRGEPDGEPHVAQQLLQAPRRPRRSPSRRAASTSVSSRTAIVPSRRWTQLPTTAPSTQTVGPALPLRSNTAAATSGSRYQRPLLPAHRRRVEARQQRHPRLGRARRASRSSGSTTARAVVQLDLDGPDVGERAGRRRGRPAGPPLQVGPGAGAERAQPRRASPAAAVRLSSPASMPPGIQPSAAAQRYWPLIHVPVGRARTTSPAKPSTSSSRVCAATGVACRPVPIRHRKRQLGQAPAEVAGGHRAVGQGARARSRDRPRSTRRDRRRRLRSGRCASIRYWTRCRSTVAARVGEPDRLAARRPTACAAWRGGGSASGRRRAPSPRRRAPGSPSGRARTGRR